MKNEKSRMLVLFRIHFAMLTILFITDAFCVGSTGTVLHSFGYPPSGANSVASLVTDTSGNFYGTTSSGGPNNKGVVFELTRNSGRWIERVLYSFQGGNDGSNPYAGLIFDKAGNLYGTTTQSGGTGNFGTVFELVPTTGGGWGEVVLYRFNGGSDGTFPIATLAFDNAGNLFGTTFNGGAQNLGTVFELTPNSGGSWTEAVLHNFSGGNDGSYPYAGLLFGGTGNFYGTTEEGGGNVECSCGTVFEMTPNSGGGWTENVIYSFAGGGIGDGEQPEAALIVDAAGNLYGTTYSGGTGSLGTVFELMPGSGGWQESVLHRFSGGADGYGPMANLILDGAGTLYGTTYYGGQKYGTVFKLVPGSNSQWIESVIHNFTGVDGENPYSALVFDGAGNLYGTTAFLGPGNLGTIFEMTPGSNGWSEVVIHSFAAVDGAIPSGPLVLDTFGNLYGATEVGGPHGLGIVFELTPSSGGWTERILYSFKGGKDGQEPNGGLIFDSAGNLYGTTRQGGVHSRGTVFELIPSLGGWREKILYSFCAVGSSCADGDTPLAGLAMDGNGNLFGTTSAGEANGSVFELIPTSAGGWKFRKFTSPFNLKSLTSSLVFDSGGNLYGTSWIGPRGCGSVFELAPSSNSWTQYAFPCPSHGGGSTADGISPYGGVIVDSTGNLYGTTIDGGSSCGCGVVFELSGWAETVLYSFTGPDGGDPYSGLIFDSAGNLYGTTYFGGLMGFGAVFELTPASGGIWTENVLYSFSGGSDGGYPSAGLTRDASGNLYGTTSYSVPDNEGVVFEITP